MITRTPDEALERYKSKMGEELGSRFHHCGQELYWTSTVWDMHETLFQNSEAVKLMNDANGGVSFAIQKVFFEYVLLGVCRLTDPARQKRSMNLTVRAFPDLVDEKLKPEIHDLVSKAQKATKTARDWRDRKLSHTDYKLKIAVTKPLAGISRIETSQAIARIHAVLNRIANWYCDTTLGLPELGDDDANGFLLHLLDGQQKKMQDRNAIESGDFSSLEDRFPDWMARRTSIGARYDLERISKAFRKK